VVVEPVVAELVEASKRPSWEKVLWWWLRQAQPPKSPTGETRSLSLWLLSLSKHRNAPIVGKGPMVVASTGSATKESCGRNAVVEPVVAELVEASKRPSWEKVL